MQAAVYSRHGSAAEVVQVATRPTATHLKPHDVLVKVITAALNPVDYKIVAGYLTMVEGILLEGPPAVTGLVCVAAWLLWCLGAWVRGILWLLCE
jgi:NADPH:quinone reductase-like Zn-dependent oxidoreductase